MNESDQEEIFFPTMQIYGARNVEKHKHYGPENNDYFWFLYPKILEHQLHEGMLEYQQGLQVTAYCPFDFSYFPFDNQYCDFKFGSVGHSVYGILLNSTRVHYSDQLIHNGEGFLPMNDIALPFDIRLESLKPFELLQSGYSYSYTGMRIHLSRNSLTQLIGSYYGPTVIFSLLSLVSYTMDLEMVRQYINSLLIKSSGMILIITSFCYLLFCSS